MPATRARDALTKLILEVFRLNGDLLAAGDDLLRDLGQSSSRWQVLGAIAEREDTVSGIARVMGLTRQSVQRTADILAAGGLVEYVDNPAHRRAKLIRLTNRGRELLDQIDPRQAKWADALIKELRLDVAEIEQSLELLLRLRSLLEGQTTPESHEARRERRRR
ncbi:MAG: MarR family winged helix-turn-helix transcriptional regulator [Actinomycetota bacterium]